MDALIDLLARALLLALLHPLTRTLLLLLGALYGVGRGWPPPVSAALSALALVSALLGVRRDLRPR